MFVHKQRRDVAQHAKGITYCVGAPVNLNFSAATKLREQNLAAVGACFRQVPWQVRKRCCKHSEF